MLGKLMKHEIRATARTMLPLYLIVLATALGAHFSIRGLLDTPFPLLDLLGGFFVVAFGISIAAVCIMSIVVMVQRFYRNLLRDEGYVMLTLPVSVHQQVWAKLIVSAVWFAATAAVVALAAFVVIFDQRGLVELFRTLGLFWSKFAEMLTAPYAFNGAAFLAEALTVGFLTCCALCLQFYAGLAAGHSFANHKMALSVAFFFLFQSVVNYLGGGLLVVFLDESPLHHWLLSWNLEGMAAIHAGMGFMALCVLIHGAVFYTLTIFFLQKRLNLE